MSDWIGLLGPTPAYAQGAAGAAGGTGTFITSFAPFILIFVLFWLLLIRPQQKRQKEHNALLEGVQKGDKIVTSGGIFGTVMAATKDVLTIQIADSVRIKILRREVMGMQDVLLGDDDKK
jgi:preprotein translocase subunit YajC